MSYEDQGTAFDSGAVGHEKVGRKKPLLCLDFDGVIHSYTSGWQGATVIPDPPVPGAIDFILAALTYFRVAIFSSRSGEARGIEAMKDWLHTQLVERSVDLRDSSIDPEQVAFTEIEWPTSKPPAFLTIDDRALYFTGTWPNPKALLAFKTWQQDGGLLAQITPPVKALLAQIAPPVTTGVDAKPPERQPFAWARERGANVTMFTAGAERPNGDGWFPLYRDTA